MSPTRIVGVVLLIAGVVLLVVGISASHSFADQVHNTFTGRFTDTTMWYIIGGIVAAVFGGLLMLFGAGGKEA
ncbi:MAG TPA: DUF3185 family protein [Tepidisphaeraceae bacterium]|nr:DUF3185 family protein [Tepidisphaeraceae bacterium]